MRFINPPFPRREAHTYRNPFVAKSGSSAMPINPASPIEWTSGTFREPICFAFGFALSNITMLPMRSVMNIRPSGANAMSHGTERPDWMTVSTSAGAPARRMTSPELARPLVQAASSTPNSNARPTGRIPRTIAHCDTRPATLLTLESDDPTVREEPRRIAGRLEATLRIPDADPRGIAVVSHPLPTPGGTMRNPLVAGIARAIASVGLYALRFNFRGVGESAGEWTGGVAEVEDLALAIADARTIAPGLPLALAGFSFGAVTTLRWLAQGGRADAVALA